MTSGPKMTRDETARCLVALVTAIDETDETEAVVSLFEAIRLRSDSAELFSALTEMGARAALRQVRR
jgi:hypothetical protein